MSYRDYLARRNIAPLVIERTQKRGGHLVLKSSALPVFEIPGRKGSFARKWA